MVPQTQTVTQPTPFFVVRFRLKKDGPLQYISHLDFVRTMQKMLVRCGLPLWYSQGFNPIPKFTFAAPLSVGTESECELMDVRLTEPLPPAECASRLSSVFPPHLEVLEAYTPTTKLNEIGYIAYDLRIAYEGACAEHAAACMRALEAEQILVEKKGKAGLHTLDIKPLIASARLSYNEKEQEIAGRLVLSASPTAFLGTETLIAALRRDTPILPEGELGYYGFCRREVYAPDMTLFR